MSNSTSGGKYMSSGMEPAWNIHWMQVQPGNLSEILEPAITGMHPVVATPSDLIRSQVSTTQPGSSGGGWKTAEHDLSFLAGEPQVQLRMHFKSYVFSGFQDGIAFDNFFVGDPYNNDIGVTALVDPSSGPSLGSTETVTVQLENFGLFDQSGFDVAYQLDGGTVVTRNVCRHTACRRNCRIYLLHNRRSECRWRLYLRCLDRAGY